VSDTQAVPQRVAFIQLEKYDATTNEFAGTMVSETPDESGEIFDYATSKPEVKKWIEAAKKRSGGKSLGNVREMHGLKAAGKLTQVDFDDKAKKIRVKGKAVDAETRLKIQEGVLCGLSIGGKYLKTWSDSENPSHIRYTAGVSEVSFVDSPCVQDAMLEFVGADGTKKMVKFAPSVPQPESISVDGVADDTIVDDEPVKPAAVTPKAPVLVKRAGATTAKEDDMTPEEIGAVLEQQRKARKEAKATKKAAKLKKWSERAKAVKVEYEPLTKAERRVFRAQYRADQALQDLEKVIGGGNATTARAIVGPVGATDDGKVGDKTDEKLTKASDVAQHDAARTVEAL
jgi:hypothetical protein